MQRSDTVPRCFQKPHQGNLPETFILHSNFHAFTSKHMHSFITLCFTAPSPQLVWEPVPGANAPLEQRLASGCHEPLHVPSLHDHLRRPPARECGLLHHIKPLQPSHTRSHAHCLNDGTGPSCSKYWQTKQNNCSAFCHLEWADPYCLRSSNCNNKDHN